ncbi:MAG: biopolymer transporter ExbD [Myxococcota bacterium]|nr:biopolymer transporter ExbD [Myxococcota bacterium]
MNFSIRAIRKRDAEINLTPLIDIVFILLIFFLITSTFVQDSGIKVELPRANQSNPTGTNHQIVVTVTAEGRMVYEGEALSKNELQKKLSGLYKEKIEQVFIIEADSTAQHGIVVSIMDLAKEIGFQSLAIATD